MQKVLIFIDWFYPAYKAGGPIKSVYNLIKAMESEFHFTIVTSDSDIHDEKLDVVVNSWQRFNGIDVIYLNRSMQNKGSYLKLFEEIKPEIIYYNSLYSFRFTLMPYQLFKKKNVQQIIAPRGMLGKGALEVKPLKKKIFLFFAKFFLFKKSTVWHASSKKEYQDIRDQMGPNAQVKLASNLSSPLTNRLANTVNKISGELKLVFISRILPIKNLLFTLELINAMPKEVQINLDVYGPIEDESYWQKCKKIIDTDQRLAYKGSLKPDQVSYCLQDYHYYILPSFHENYGHGIVEAIVSGVPIIISDKTPWKNLESEGIGASIKLDDKKQWENFLLSALTMNQSDYLISVENCFSFAKKKIFQEELVDEYRRLFYI